MVAALDGVVKSEARRQLASGDRAVVLMPLKDGNRSILLLMANWFWFGIGFSVQIKFLI
jgi:hypothetical protein